MGIPNVGTQRPLVVQQFRTLSVAVTAAALPLDPITDKTKLVTSFIISNPVAGASVFVGNAGVTTTTGLEIPPGTAPNFLIDQGARQLYELQQQLMEINAALSCRQVPLDGLPFVVWDLSTLYIVAAAPTTVSLIVFPSMYI